MAHLPWSQDKRHASLSATSPPAAHATSRVTRVYVNGLPLRESAIVRNSVTYVPLRAVAESLGCTVDGACPERTRGDPKAGVFVWGGQQSLTSPASRPMEPQPHRPSLPTPGQSRRSLGRAGRDGRTPLSSMVIDGYADNHRRRHAL